MMMNFYRRTYAALAFAWLLAVAVLLCSPQLKAQKITYSWDPSGKFVVGGGVGLTKYYGEFTDQHYGSMFELYARYFIIPEVAIQANAGFGNYRYNRRIKNEFRNTYARQFFRDPRLTGLTDIPASNAEWDALAFDPLMRNQVLESNKFSVFEGRAVINFFPKRQVNPYFSVGAGMMTFTNDNINAVTSTGDPLLNVTFDNKKFTVIRNTDPKDAVESRASNLYGGANKLAVIPVGFGVDVMVTEIIAVNFDVSYRFLIGDGNDMLDGFGKAVQENFDRAGYVERVTNIDNPDSWASASIGVQVYLGGDTDRDGDGLSDSREQELNTDPLNPDTDGDGLLDGAELNTYETDPLKTDTDGDRLTDAEEIAKGTDPRNPDTDGDGLIEGDEFAHGTDPFSPDTDNDGLTDGEEVHTYHSDPLKVDSDADGVDDKTEVLVYKSDPRSPDSDNDGITDAREIALGLAITGDDADGDGLKDGDELNTYGTDPKNADTDGDGLNDGAEIAAGSDPRATDSDGDGIRDGEDKCPAEAETVNGYRDDDGCPDGEPLTRGAISVGQVFTLGGLDFASGSGEPGTGAAQALAPLLQTLRDNPSMRVEIGGHTDNRGAAAANKKLSQERAAAVKAWLVSQGVKASRVDVAGYGETKPTAGNGSAAGRAKNNRIEATVLAL